MFNQIFDIKNGYIRKKNVISLSKTGYKEQFDVAKLKIIIDNEEDILKLIERPDARNSVQLNTYYNDSKAGFHSVKYFQPNNQLYGRYYAKNGAASMLREVRHTIFYDNYFDYDFTNCHPCILSWICKNLDIDCPLLDFYISERDEIIKDIPNIKVLAISIINGGSADFNNLEKKDTFIIEFYNEIQRILKRVNSKLFKFKEIISNKDNSYNVEGRTLNAILIFVENQILIRLVKFIRNLISNTNVDKLILCFDGLMIPKDANIDLVLVNEFIEGLGIDMKLINKQMKPIDLTGFYPRQVEDETNWGDITESEQKIILDIIFNDDGFTDLLGWEIFQALYAKYFYIFDNKLYYYKNGRWIKSSTFESIHILFEKMYHPLKSHLNHKINTCTDENECKYLFSLKTIISKRLSSFSQIEAISKFCRVNITINENIFDKQINLVNFTNGTYDLHTATFREHRYDDYITESTGYDYRESTEEEREYAQGWMDQIMPNKENLDILFEVMASGLYGVTLEKFIVLTGSGRNGKDTLMSVILPFILGSYFYTGCISTVTKEPSSGPSPEIANLHNKRFSLFNEPSEHIKLNNSAIKKISGTDVINARQLYSNNTVTNICVTMVLMCNKMPQLDHVDNAIKARIEIIPFNSTFLSADQIEERGLVVGENNTYLVDTYYKSRDFLEKMRYPMLSFILEAFKRFQSNKFALSGVSNEIKECSRVYLEDSDEFMGWFSANYRKTNNIRDFIKLDDLFSNYRSSEYFGDLSKYQRRSLTRKKFCNNIITNANIGKFFNDRKKIDQIYYRSIIINHVKIDDEIDDEIEY